eukprot:13947-Heterococcus_DN1.PRE.4
MLAGDRHVAVVTRDKIYLWDPKSILGCGLKRFDVPPDTYRRKRSGSSSTESTVCCQFENGLIRYWNEQQQSISTHYRLELHHTHTVKTLSRGCASPLCTGPRSLVHFHGFLKCCASSSCCDPGGTRTATRSMPVHESTVNSTSSARHDLMLTLTLLATTARCLASYANAA